MKTINNKLKTKRWEEMIVLYGEEYLDLDMPVHLYWLIRERVFRGDIDVLHKEDYEHMLSLILSIPDSLHLYEDKENKKQI